MIDHEYRFSATQNNGRITQMKDWVSGEEVTYQYDALSRLISAVTTGPEWGQSFSYDGLGWLLSSAEKRFQGFDPKADSTTLSTPAPVMVGGIRKQRLASRAIGMQAAG